MPEDITSLKQRLAELEELNHLAQTLSSTLDVDDILAAIIDCSIKLCRAERATILLFDPISNEVVKTLVRGPNPALEGINHALNVVIAGWILHHGEPFLTQDIIKDSRFKKSSKELQLCGSALAIPLRADGKIIGIINLVNSRGGVPFLEDSLRVAGIIASMASQFIHRAKFQETLFEDNRRLKRALQHQFELHSILGGSPAMQDVFKKINLLSSSTATVLVVGETGTGKELVARAIHFQSPRADKSFIAINCAAIPAALFESELFGHEAGAFTGATGGHKGKFALANQGTLFLDEISEMPTELQPKLLRVLEERKFYPVGSSAEVQVDVRVIAASSKDLSQSAQRGEFREALFHRLNVLPISLPPLRERREDIPLLARAFLEEFTSNTKSFTPDAMQMLSDLEWKGNVRELRNLVERISIYISSKVITTEHLLNLNIGIEAKQASPLSTNQSDHIASAFQELLLARENKGDLLELIDKKLVQLALQYAQGNVAEASRLLGIHRRALERRIEKHKI